MRERGVRRAWTRGWSTARFWLAACLALSFAGVSRGQEVASPKPADTPTTTPETAAPSTPTAAGKVDTSTPIAIIPNDSKDPASAVEIRGGVDIYQGKAAIESSGTITAGEKTVAITLPSRGQLLLCGASKVSLSMDSEHPSNDRSGLMMALDHGALEANMRTGQNSDIVLTPDFRILISGPGVAAVRVRLGADGDTCVDNHGVDAPYVTVNGLFDGGVYRVQADQHVMFQHGSLKQVVDNEKEPCGCPVETPETLAAGNAFPLAQSAGLTGAPPPRENPAAPGVVGPQAKATLNYDGTKPKEPEAKVEMARPITPVITAPPPAASQKKKARSNNLFVKIGHMFRNIFGG